MAEDERETINTVDKAGRRSSLSRIVRAQPWFAWLERETSTQTFC